MQWCMMRPAPPGKINPVSWADCFEVRLGKNRFIEGRQDMKWQQAEMFLWFIGFGIICGLIYDLLRAFRREIRHGTAAVMTEDILFCAAACSGCYAIFFLKNNGALRAYGFIGILLGAALYYLTISRGVLMGFRWCFKGMLFPFRYLVSKCKKWKFIRKALTNRK